MTRFPKNNIIVIFGKTNMWYIFWNSAHKREVMVSSNDDGIQKVIDDEGKYAFFMESASIEYIVERKCKVTQVGGLLDNKVYSNSSLIPFMLA